MNRLSCTFLVSQNFPFVISSPKVATWPDMPHSERHNYYQLEELLISHTGWRVILSWRTAATIGKISVPGGFPCLGH